MIVFLRTATPLCEIAMVGKDGWQYETGWEAGRGLAKGLLAYLQTEIEGQGKKWSDVTGLVVYRGPGSFTGLRIGITVMNTVADVRGLPIVGVTGDTWREQGRVRLAQGEDDRIVLPEYGSDAKITTPRK